MSFPQRVAAGAAAGIVTGSILAASCEGPSSGWEPEFPNPEPAPTHTEFVEVTKTIFVKPEAQLSLAEIGGLGAIIVRPLGATAVSRVTSEVKAHEVLLGVDHQMDITTAGLSSMSFVDVREAEIIPSGESMIQYRPGKVKTAMDGFEPCYSDADINRLALSNINEINDRKVLDIIITDGSVSACSNNHSAGVAANIGNQPTMLIESSSFNEHVVIHELGHYLGLGHAAKLACEASPTSRMVSRSKQDIGFLIRSNQCDAVRHKDGTIDDYADTYTDMGSKSGTFFFDGLSYSFIEINTIAPAAAHIEELRLNVGEYKLSLNEGEKRGIKINLPDGHPFKSLDGTIQYVAFGLDVYSGQQGPISQLRVLAGGAGNTYELGYTYPYAPKFDYSRGPTIVYTDYTLGIEVTADIPDGVSPDSNEVLLQLRRPEQPTISKAIPQ